MRIHLRIRPPLTLVAAVLLGVCADPSLAPSKSVANALPAVSYEATTGQGADVVRGLITVGQAKARYHDFALAKADGFICPNGCETRGDEGLVGVVVVHMDGLTDGGIDPAKPDAMTYETIWIPASAGLGLTQTRMQEERTTSSSKVAGFTR